MAYIPWTCIWKFVLLSLPLPCHAMPLTIDWSGVWIHVGAHVASVDPSYMSSCVFEYEKKWAVDEWWFWFCWISLSKNGQGPRKILQNTFYFSPYVMFFSNENPGNHLMSQCQSIYRSLKSSRKLVIHI